MIDPRLSDIFTIPRILGSFPMDEKFILSKKWLTYTVIIQSINVHTMVVGFHYYFLKEHSPKPVQIIKLFIYSVVLLSVFCNLFMVVRLILSRRYIFQLLEKISRAIAPYEDFPKLKFGYIYCILFIVILFANFLTFTYDSATLRSKIIHYGMLITSCTSPISIMIQFSNLMQILTVQVGNINVYSDFSVTSLENLISLSDSVHDTYESYLLITVISISLRLIIHSYIILLPLFPGNLLKNIMLIVYMAVGIISIASIAHSYCSFLHKVLLLFSYCRKIGKNKL